MVIQLAFLFPEEISCLLYGSDVDRYLHLYFNGWVFVLLFCVCVFVYYYYYCYFFEFLDLSWVRWRLVMAPCVKWDPPWKKKEAYGTVAKFSIKWKALHAVLLVVSFHGPQSRACFFVKHEKFKRPHPLSQVRLFQKYCTSL